MTLIRTCLLAAACLLPALASAQWQWVDNQGRRVFSDRSPPPEVPAKNILRQPGGAPPPQAGVAEATPAAAVAAASPPAATASGALKPAGRDAQLEERRKQAEATEVQKKKAQEEAVAATRQENCKLATRAKKTLDAGVRVVQTNDKGEREILDDRQRATEVKRLDAVIAQDCVPAAQ
jgi:hypothetical protein